MSFTTLGLVVLLLSGCFLGAAYAQVDDSAQVDESQLPPTDYGAGYKIVILHQQQEHDPGPGDDDAGQGPIKLDKTYPLIANPLSQEAKAFNAKMQYMAAKWWGNMDAPHDNTTASDPNTDYSLDCKPAGLPAPVDAPSPSGEQMLPGVISVACGNYVFTLGAAHGGGENWGFNWLVHEKRELKASDVFSTRTRWLDALTAVVNAGRLAFNPGAQKLDFSDTSHWVVETAGLGLTYSMAEFSGAEDGGMGTFDLVPWSKLAPYLRKDGIVPQADWSATAIPGN